MQDSFYNLIWCSEVVCYFGQDLKVGVVVLIEKLFSNCKTLVIFNLLVTRCTNKFNIQQLYALRTLYLCVV
jgi:hypothetical protein